MGAKGPQRCGRCLSAKKTGRGDYLPQGTLYVADVLKHGALQTRSIAQGGKSPSRPPGPAVGFLYESVFGWLSLRALAPQMGVPGLLSFWGAFVGFAQIL